MKISISDPHVRKAIHRAYKGQCFFTGRPVSEEDMAIDHLIPKSKGGEDSFENFVLTFHDLNSGKSNKLDNELERMRWAVRKIYAPRAQKIYEKISNKIQYQVKIDDELETISLRKFKTRISPPSNLNTLKSKDLFWVDDNKILLLSSITDLSNEEIYDIDREIETYTELALNNEADYCINVWLPPEKSAKFKSIWYSVDGCFLKLVKKVEYYEKDSPEKWAYLYFTNQYMNFVKWQNETNECLEKIFELSDSDEYDKQLKRFCSYFPRPYWAPLDERKMA
ncbi:MAG: HNH endonuclease domain-containing protein [Desulfuromonadaceae bacterium]|nr:HNH endonuclease domain-containing protein [Desulfuromonadaceae bacterium]MDD5105774.1 HNH endonuclease domain-containing protein [Desulfuromonadaceae bacterium]